MGAEFDKSITVNTIFEISIFAVVLSGGVFFGFLWDEYIMVTAVSGIRTLIFTALCVIFGSYKGCISAEENGIKIAFVIFRQGFIKKTIEYNKIECAKCDIDSIGTRYGGIIYKMIFTLKMKNGSEFTALKKLDIESGFPASQPEEYKKYLAEQPLQILCDFINEQIGTRV